MSYTPETEAPNVAHTLSRFGTCITARDIYEEEGANRITGEEYVSGSSTLDTTRVSSTQFVGMGTAAHDIIEAEHPGMLTERLLANGESLGYGTGEFDITKGTAEQTEEKQETTEETKDPYATSEAVRDVFMQIAAGLGGGGR